PALIGVYYRVRTDALWRTRDVLLSHGGGPRVHLVSDGAGNWSDAQSGDDLPALAGCLDVDIGLTPATNTLPIRRLDLAQGETAVLRVVFLPPHTSDPGPRVMAQSYTCQKPGTKYRYHGVDSDFTADLEVDARGLVLDYPETFRRLD
ncbi:MAG: putative glycolipid-binding domain-containing protein, partial [Pseudomonadota bacterium]